MAVSPAAAVSLSADEAAAAATLAAAFAAVLPPGQGGPYRALATTARAGTVPAEQVETLEQVCALALETGKARQLGRAEYERVLAEVLRRTPRGRAMAEEAADVNRALGQLAAARSTARG